MNTPPILPLTPSLPPPPKSEEDLLKWTRHFTLSLAKMYRTLALRLDKMTLEGVLADRPDADGSRRYYWATDTNQHFYDEAGTWVETSGGGGGAPTDATYIVQAADDDLDAEQALDELDDGILKHASGVVAQAIAGTDYPTVADVALNTAHRSSAPEHYEIADTALGPTDLYSAEHIRKYISVLNGAAIEVIDVNIIESGGTVYAELQAEGGGNLHFLFSTGIFLFASTPAETVALSAGTDEAPTLNYVYVLQSTGALTANTSDWPEAEHAPICTAFVQSAASVASKKVMKLHVWTDEVDQPFGQGHLSDLSHWVREQPATYKNGVEPSLTITVGPGSDTVIFNCTAGEVSQLHHQTFPAFTGTPDIYAVNDFTTPHKILTDLNQMDAYSDGTPFSNNDRFSIVLKGVVSGNPEDCKLLLGLPSAGYRKDSQAINDANGYSDYSAPIDYRGCVFLIARYTLKYSSAGSGTLTLVSGGYEDLRGQYPSTIAGGASFQTTEFADTSFEIFNALDSTKTAVFDAQNISPGTERTYTLPDSDETIGTDQTAIHGDVAGEILDIAEKTVPVGTDEFLIEEADGTKKSVKLFNINPAILRVPFRYSTIAAAIAAASIGDIIDIAPGTYNENLIVNVAKIKMRGYGEATLINGGTIESAVIINADKIHIHDFAVQTTIASGNFYYGVIIHGFLCVIVERIVVNDSDYIAFRFNNSQHCTLKDCTIFNADDIGVYTNPASSYISLIGNRIIACRGASGIYAENDYGQILGNTVLAGSSTKITLSAASSYLACTTNFTSNHAITNSGSFNQVIANT